MAKAANRMCASCIVKAGQKTETGEEERRGEERERRLPLLRKELCRESEAQLSETCLRLLGVCIFIENNGGTCIHTL